MGAIDFERAALGAVLLNPGNWESVAVLRSDEFLLDSHRRIYARMADLAGSSRPIDMITLISELDRHRELQMVGDVAYILSLTEGLPDRPVDSVRHYVNEVRKCAGLRRIVHLADSIREQATDPVIKIGDLRNRLLEAEREAAQYEAEAGVRITRVEDIPDPFACSSEEVGWVVHGLVPARGVTIIAGEAGAGKTWLALTLARAITFGDDFLGRRTLNTHVLYLDRENPLRLIRDRLQMLFGGPSEFRPWGLWCQDAPPMIGDPRLLEFAQTGPVLIIDSMIRFHGADENSATQMAPVMASLRELATLGASVVVLHHKPKSETSSYRGSSDIVAGADAAFALVKRGPTLELQKIKNRFAAETTVEIQADFPTGTFSVTGMPGSECITEVARLADIIRVSPGSTQNQVINRCGMNRQSAIDLLQCHTGKLWQRKKGKGRSLCYFPIEVVPKEDPSQSMRNRLWPGSGRSSNSDSDLLESVGIAQVVPVFPPFSGGNREQLAYHGA